MRKKRMSLLKSKIIGILMICIGLILGGYYTLCVLVNGFNENKSIFRDESFLGIPILNEYWTIAAPIFLACILLVFLICWIGVATLFIKEPQVSDEEIKKVRDLDEKNRAKLKKQ